MPGPGASLRSPPLWQWLRRTDALRARSAAPLSATPRSGRTRPAGSSTSGRWCRKAGQAQGGICGDGALAVDDRADAVHGHTQFAASWFMLRARSSSSSRSISPGCIGGSNWAKGTARCPRFPVAPFSVFVLNGDDRRPRLLEFTAVGDVRCWQRFCQKVNRLNAGERGSWKATVSPERLCHLSPNL